MSLRELLDLLALTPLAMVQKDQGDELADSMRSNIIAKLVMPALPVLVACAVAFGGMSWAVSSIERQMGTNDTRIATSCSERENVTLDRMKIVEARQIDVLNRLAVVEALLRAHDERERTRR